MESTTRSVREVYFNEYNILMGGITYLPLVSGILQSYAETFPALRESYRFMPYLFHWDDPDRIIAQYRNPAVAAFSVSMWNEQLCLRVAQEVKRRFPDCLVVLGGPSVPYEAEGYFARNPFIDVTVRSEGEEPFRDILARSLEGRDFSGIDGISYRDLSTGRCVRNPREREQAKDLDTYPSPYLSGKFEPLIRAHPEIEFQAIIETNRGCPFPCTFCFWGQGGLSMKYRYYSMERVQRILDWCGRSRIRYVFNADSNFGMLKRDYEIAEYIVETKRKHGFPEKFRTCFGKNSDDKIFRIGKLLHQNGLEKGITLARQSNDPETLKNVRRDNIKLSTYRALQVQYNQDDIPVYTELILGMPGETYDTWLAGIEEILQAGIKNQLFCYLCQVYPNTEMDHADYRERFGIRTVFIELCEFHGSVRPPGALREREEVIISSYSMTVEDWRRMTVLSWVMLLMHSMKMGFYVMAYLANRFGLRYVELLEHLCGLPDGDLAGTMLAGEVSVFRRHAEAISRGEAGRGVVLPEFGSIYLEGEEASFLRLSCSRDRFYEELLRIVQGFLRARGVPYDLEEVEEVVLYQRMRIPSPVEETAPVHVFSRNVPEYLDRLFLERPVALVKEPQRFELTDAASYAGDKARFMRERVIFGRKSGTLLRSGRWSSAGPVPAVVPS